MIHVLLVGPAPQMIGGIATVVQQIMDLDTAGRVRFHLFPITTADSRRELLPSRVWRHFRQLLRLVRTIRRQRIDLVHIHTCSDGSFFRSAADLAVVRSMFGLRRSVVLHIHGGRFEEFYRRNGWVGRWCVRAILRNADTVVALSERWAARLRTISPQARIDVVENACPSSDTCVASRELLSAIPADEPSSRGTESVTPSVVSAEIKPDEVFDSDVDSTRRPPCRFLMISRLDRAKGVLDLLDAAAALRGRVPFTLEIAGPAGTLGDASDLRTRIARMGLQDVVHASGPVVGSQKDRWLADADVFLLPSHAEGMPICVLEAMDYGLPTIASDVGALPEMIESGRDGLLVRASDVAALSRAMGSLALDPSLRQTLGEQARKTARARFSQQRMGERLVGLYERLVGESMLPLASRSDRASRDAEPVSGQVDRGRALQMAARRGGELVES